MITILRGRRAACRWYDVRVDVDELDSAIDRVSRRLCEARAEWNPDLEALNVHELALLHFRRGDAAEACDRFAELRSLARELEWDPADVVAVGVAFSVSAYRAGRLDEAARGFERALDLCASELETETPELRAGLAVVAAAQGELDRMEREARQAVERAALDGDANVQMRVARWIGEALLQSGRREHARETLEGGLALVGAPLATNGNPGASPEDVLGLVLAARAAGAHDLEHVVTALRLGEAALDDPNAWWDLPRLLDAAIDLARSSDLDEDDIVVRSRRLARIASQRPDCREAALALMRRLAAA